MNTASIKNLAIAYEALSRCAGAKKFLDRVNNLLNRVLREAEDEQRSREIYPDTPKATPTQDDEIPF